MGIEHLEPAERSYGQIVQERRAVLLGLLTDEEKTTRRVTKTSGRAYPWTFEDSARQIVSAQTPERWETVSRALIAYQSAVNDFWGHVYREKVPEFVVGQWFRKFRRQAAKGIDRSEMEAEVIFMLRDAIRRWNPSEGVPFKLYACRVIFDDLSEWVRQQWSVVERSRAEKRQGFVPKDYEIPGEDNNDEEESA